MKGLLGWVKSNLLIVVPLVLAIIAMPVGIYFSSGWNKKIREKVSADVRQAESSLNAKVTYTIPQSVPGEKEINVSLVPNATANARAKELLEQVVADSAEVREIVVSHNSKGKDGQLLIGGPGSPDRLFPEPAGESQRVSLLEKLHKSRPQTYQKMLADHGAGAPPNAENVLARLVAARDEEVSRILSTRVEQKLTAEEEQQIRERLSAMRVERYRTDARSLSFYATNAIFDPPLEWNSRDLPEMDLAWDWQHTYWMHCDIFDAIEKANTNPRTGVRETVEYAPVKRVESIRIRPLFAPKDDRGGPNTGEPAPTETVAEDLTQAIAPDYSERHTGRIAWPSKPNGFFDIREAEVTLIADSASLPRIIDAFNSTNFMTVASTTIVDHDAHADLASGYYYGAADLVRVRLTLETIWIRAWVKRFMPPVVRERLGVAPDPASEPEGA
ncbi:MAG: hypothetical protein H6812_00920 [Phycisphaeraceae bacterium]|nr:hypothetical protein [Phycisphaerales bacterium]MCB9841797.1 hypothetical protein [Phycisphaeraceae bacterium]